MGHHIIKGLAPSFHQSFLPERRHLASLLDAASHGLTGAVEAISEHTGIPTGKSSGKVVPHLKYAQAMGLINVTVAAAGVYELKQTCLGKAVLAEDPLLNETLTQLVLHLMLSRPGGASVWHSLFGRSRVALGRHFSPEEATKFLNRKFGNSTSIPGPLVSTYRENASLARTAMLSVEKNLLTRGSLPPVSENFLGYAYCWLHSWEQEAPNDQQLPSSQLEVFTAFEELAGWDRQQLDEFLSWMVDHRILKIDRQTGVPLLMKTVKSAEIALQIYSDLL